MIYGRDAINRGQAGSVLGFGPGYTGGGFVGLPDPAQLQAQQAAQQQAAQQQAVMQQQVAMQQAQAQAMVEAQQQMAQAQMATAQQQAPMYLPPHIDALWAKLLSRLSASALADDSELFADVSAVVIQSFAPDSMAQEALKRWAVQYSGLAQQQQQAMPQQEQEQIQVQQQIETPMTVPQQMQVQQEQTAQQQQASGPFVAGRWRNR